MLSFVFVYQGMTNNWTKAYVLQDFLQLSQQYASVEVEYGYLSRRFHNLYPKSKNPKIYYRIIETKPRKNPNSKATNTILLYAKHIPEKFQKLLSEMDTWPPCNKFREIMKLMGSSVHNGHGRDVGNKGDETHRGGKENAEEGDRFCVSDDQLKEIADFKDVV